MPSNSARRPPIALSIAGSDSSGGAGIQGDLKTFSALGVYGATVISALTAQNTQGLRGIHHPPAAFVRAQLEAVLADLDVAAIKVGMLGSAEIAKEVVEGLREHGRTIDVLDPVLRSSSGHPLLEKEALDCLRTALLPHTRLLTPNLHEAAVLLGQEERDILADSETACRALLDLGPNAILLKGGHIEGESSTDLFLEGGSIERLESPRVRTPNTHGTGCALSAAIAAFLARGRSLLAAAREAKAWLTLALAAADRLGVGQGAGPVHHFWREWEER